MSKVLIERMRKQRELEVKVGNFTFIARRPTDAQLIEVGRNIDLCEKFVIGWNGVTENDIIGGGGTDPIPFSAALWAEMYGDHPEFWEPIAAAILAAYQAHAASAAETSPR